MTARMGFARTALLAGLVAAALNLSASPAKANLISVTSFGFTANSHVVGIAPFNPALGTLDSVNVSVSGTFDVLTEPSANIVQGGPIPYSFTVAASQSFAAIFAGRGFDTVIAAELHPRNGAATQLGRQGASSAFSNRSLGSMKARPT